MSFKTLRDKVYRDTMLNTAYHAETVLLIADCGKAQDQAAYDVLKQAAIDANKYMVCSITEAEWDPIINDGLIRSEEIYVQCCKDPAATNSSDVLLGGIDKPNIHLGLLRSVARDPEQRPYLFDYEAKHESETLWRLRFSRKLQISSAGGREG